MKLLVSDYDVTIVEGEHVSNEVLSLIKQIHEDPNYMFAIATGRSFDDLDSSAKTLQIPYDYAITLNGSIITTTTGQIIRERTIPNEIVEKGLLAMAKVMDHHQIKAIVSTKEDRHAFSSKNDIDDFLKVFRTHNEAYYGLGLDCVSKSEEEAHEVSLLLEKENIPNCEIVKCLFYVDIMYDGISKSDAISYIEKLHQVHDKHLYVIGDSFNDISMFSNTNNSFTFHNSPKEVKEKATYHVDSIIECINKMIDSK